MAISRLVIPAIALVTSSNQWRLAISVAHVTSTTADGPLLMHTSCPSLAVVVDVMEVGCDTLQVNYTINHLPGGDSNDASLQSLTVNSRPIFGGGSLQTKTVPLNRNTIGGVVCLSGLTSDTDYRVTYEVEVMTSSSNQVPSDIPVQVEKSTGNDCGLPEQCSECSCISHSILCALTICIPPCVTVPHAAEAVISISGTNGDTGERS